MSDPATKTRPRTNTSLFAALCLAAVTFLTGINWGLPSRWADPYLFGGRQPWTGAQIMQLAGPWATNSDRGADRPQTQSQVVAVPIVVNATDADRAEIVRRYRLYSQQPDEMITFRSLSGMDPARGKLDPRLYQYGGLWIYPVGAIIKAASVAHIATVRSDVAWYLDHPDDFARFYLLARFYSVAWGLAGVFVVYAVAKRYTASEIGGWLAAALFAAMPVVINSAHEAKPHLAGTVLTIACVGAGLKFLQTGRPRCCLIAGLLAGASAGMVLTGYAAFAVPVVAAMTCPVGLKKRVVLAISACAIGVAVFAVTNPYLVAGAIFHRDLAGSNLGNTAGMYHPAVSLGSMENAADLILTGTSPAPLIIAGIAVMVCLFRRRFPAGTPVLIAPAAVVLVQFVLLATDKPAEYARFAEAVGVTVSILAAGAVARVRWSDRERHLAGAALVAATLWFGIRYDINFIGNDRPGSSRLMSSDFLRRLGNLPIAVRSDPAPYCLPPVNLFDQKITLLPRGSPPRAGQVVVVPTDDGPGISSPISWANKPIKMTQDGSPLFVEKPNP